MASYVGLDGFRGGWVAAWIDDGGWHSFDYSPHLSRLLASPFQRAMIDIPIGLPERGYRHCDIQARQCLGSSVFLGARRNLLNFRHFDEANRFYWKHEGTGWGISLQLWNIRDKIGEVDSLISPDVQDTICEAHPEMIFWNRNDRCRLEPKKSAEGRNRRIDILRRCGFDQIEGWLGRRHGTGIGRDDLIDACACALAARDSTSSLGNGERDSRDLLSNIHY